MKNFTSLYLAAVSLFSFTCFAQSRDINSAVAKFADSQSLYASASNDPLVVVSYHVEETRYSNVGSHITIYNVPTLSMVDTYDLGPNNTRVVTFKYGKAKQKLEAVTLKTAGITMNERLTKPVVILNSMEPIKAEVETPNKVAVKAYVDVIATYERILQKGYRSVDMMRRVANARYFEGNLPTAAKWYSELFALSTNLDDAYYYRYAVALKSIGKLKEADKMMAIFESKVAKGHL